MMENPNLQQNASGAEMPDSVIGRLHAELEQAKVTIEDMEQRVTDLQEANDLLRRQLAEAMRRNAVAEAAAEQLHEVQGAQAEAARQDQQKEMLLRQQLSTTLEELQVMAEELELAHTALRRAEGPV